MRGAGGEGREKRAIRESRGKRVRARRQSARAGGAKQLYSMLNLCNVDSCAVHGQKPLLQYREDRRPSVEHRTTQSVRYSMHKRHQAQVTPPNESEVRILSAKFGLQESTCYAPSHHCIPLIHMLVTQGKGPHSHFGRNGQRNIRGGRRGEVV